MPLAPTKAATGPVATRPAPTDPPGQAPSPPTSQLTAPTPWASGQVTDPAGFAPAREAARQAGDSTHLVEVTLPGRSWTEIGAENAVIPHATATSARVVYDVPLSVDGATLEETAAGAHDARWRGFGAALASSRRTNIVRLRLPELANPDSAKQAFRRTAQLVRAQNPLTRIEWSAPVGSDPGAADASWPGADVVDVIGLDIPAAGSWTQVLTDDGGLIDWADWASGSGRQVALHWQLGPDTDAAWVQNVNAWIQVLVSQRRLSYETMTEHGTPNPAAAQAYRALW